MYLVKKVIFKKSLPADTLPTDDPKGHFWSVSSQSYRQILNWSFFDLTVERKLVSTGLELLPCPESVLHYHASLHKCRIVFLRYNFISWHTKAQKFQGAAHHLKSLWMVYYGRHQCQMTVIEVIFTFRVMVGMETISKRTRCCCAMLRDKNRRGRKRTKIELIE